MPDTNNSATVQENQYDKYARRCINWMLYGILLLFGATLQSISLSFNSKLTEIISVFSEKAVIALLAFALYGYNRIKLFRQPELTTEEKEPVFQKKIRLIFLLAVGYCVLGCVLHYAFERVFVLDIRDFLSTVYLLGMLAYNVVRIKRLQPLKRRVSYGAIGVILVIIIAGLSYKSLSRDIWLTQPYINSIPNINQSACSISYDDANGVYTITKADASDFKILQLTDIHLGGGVLSYDKDLKALQSVFSLLEETRPDLVIVTGDLTYPVGLSSFSFNNTAPVQQFAAFMRNTGIPWAFTYGNHDTEDIAATSAVSLDALYQSLSYKTSRTLLYPYMQADITGRNNQVIEIRNQDGSLNQALFLIDSNAYTGPGFSEYDYIHEDQVAWYEKEVVRLKEKEGKAISSLAFFHIPLQEYRTAFELYESGSSDVKYFFGSNNEAICCSDYPSGFFEKMKELGSTKAVFCGHDHYNNISMEYQGIRLTYGMSIDYLAMPGIARSSSQRGGTLITLSDDGTVDIMQIPLDTISSSAE